MKVPPLLRKLISISSIPGHEGELAQCLAQSLSSYGKITWTRWGDFYCSLSEKPSLPSVVVTAHMDSPGFIVKDLHADGTLLLIHLGGINPDYMHLRQVKLCTSRGASFSGVVHVEGKSAGLHTEYRGFFGFKSDKSARKKGVDMGDGVSFSAPIVEMADDFISAPHLDNRVGCYLLTALANKIQKSKLAYNLHFAATTCEELGGRGAGIIAKMLEPAVAICLDVTYDDSPVEMDKGPVVTLSDRSVCLSPQIRDHLVSVAKRARVAFQKEVYNYAGTDADGFREVGRGCVTVPILLATRNNHSPFEIFNLRDLDRTVKFVLALLKNLGPLLVEE